MTVCSTAFPATFEQTVLKELEKENLHGIPAKYVLAVTILETGHGTGHVYKETNNLFSITAEEEYHGEFFSDGHIHYRKYKTRKESIRDFIRLITTRDRYESVANAGINEDYKEFFSLLGRSGYSEDKHYGRKLTRIYDGLLNKGEI